jgi:GMP synthase (glutamine-hydrolysing)
MSYLGAMASMIGNGRTYDYIVSLRAVTSTDGMTAEFYVLDMKFLGGTAAPIVNEINGVNRGVHDVTSRPPGTLSASKAAAMIPSSSGSHLA